MRIEAIAPVKAWLTKSLRWFRSFNLFFNVIESVEQNLLSEPTRTERLTELPAKVGLLLRWRHRFVFILILFINIVDNNCNLSVTFGGLLAIGNPLVDVIEHSLPVGIQACGHHISVRSDSLNRIVLGQVPGLIHRAVDDTNELVVCDQWCVLRIPIIIRIGQKCSWVLLAARIELEFPCSGGEVLDTSAGKLALRRQRFSRRSMPEPDGEKDVERRFT